MELELIHRIIRLNTFIGIVVAAAACVYFNINDGVGVLAGTLWGSLNLALTKNLVVTSLKKDGTTLFKILFGLLVKFPFVYFVGYLLLITFSYESLLVGFSLLFLVIFSLVLKMIMQENSSYKGKSKIL